MRNVDINLKQVVGSILETVTAEMKAGPGPESGICSCDLLKAKGIVSKPVIDSKIYVGGLQYHRMKL